MTRRAYAVRKGKFIKIIILIVIVVVLAVSASLYLQKNETESSEPKIKITNFYFYSDAGNPVGMLFDYWFNITIENAGKNNVGGLVLKVTVSVNNSDVNYGNYFVGTYENGTLKDTLAAGEVKEFQGALLWVLGREPYVDFSSNETSVIATVTLNNTVIAERNLNSAETGTR